MKAQKGFTLMEIIVALVIVGIVAVMTLPNLISSMEQTKAQMAQNNLLAIMAAQEKFYEDFNASCLSSGISPCYCINQGTNPDGNGGSCGDTTAHLDTNLHVVTSDNTFTYLCQACCPTYSPNCSATCSPATELYQCTATDATNGVTLTLDPGEVSPRSPVSCAGPAGDCPA